MKVFKVGECDWIAANSETEALEFYKECMGYSDKDIKDDETTARELSGEEMLKLKHTGDEGEPYPTPITFKDELEKELKVRKNEPWLFASTEC